MRQPSLDGQTMTLICIVISVAAVLPMMAVAQPTITIERAAPTSKPI